MFLSILPVDVLNTSFLLNTSYDCFITLLEADLMLWPLLEHKRFKKCHEQRWHVNVTDYQTLFHYASNKGYTNITRRLLNRGLATYALGDLDDPQKTTLIRIRKEPINTLDPQTVFLNAAQLGFTNLVLKMMEQYNVHPTAQNNHAIQWASRNGHTAVVKLLLNDTRVDPTALDNRAIQLASRNGHTAIVELIEAWKMRRSRQTGKLKRTKI